MISLCSAWDWNYHAKGLALIESLRHHVPDFALCVLALDEWVFNHFEQHRQRGIVAILSCAGSVAGNDDVVYQEDSRMMCNQLTGEHVFIYSDCQTNQSSSGQMVCQCGRYQANMQPIIDELKQANITPTELWVSFGRLWRQCCLCGQIHKIGSYCPSTSSGWRSI